MSIYEGEVIPMHDPLTGQETDVAQSRRQEAEQDELIVQSQRIETLMRSRGWKVVDKWLGDQVIFLNEKLIVEENLNIVVRLQEAIKAYSNVQRFVTDSVREGKDFLDRKRALEDQANPKE